MSLSGPALRSPALLALVGIWIVETLLAGRIAVAQGFVASLPPQTLDDLRNNWLVAGSAVSMPIQPIVALVVIALLAQLPWRSTRVIAGVAAVLLTAVVVVATFGEETFLAPLSWLEFGLQVVNLVMALALAAAGVAVGRTILVPRARYAQAGRAAPAEKGSRIANVHLPERSGPRPTARGTDA